jgi:hypothetical protein
MRTFACLQQLWAEQSFLPLLVVPAILVIAITAAWYDSDNAAITTADGAPQNMQVTPEPL